METKKRNEILSLDEIKILVDSFYSKVRNDKVLSPIFIEILQDNWEKHLDKMYRFWQTILLDEHTYFGSPFLHHANLPIDKNHFDKWLNLFHKTIDENFIGMKAEEAKIRSIKMAEIFQLKLDSHKKNQNLKPLL